MILLTIAQRHKNGCISYDNIYLQPFFCSLCWVSSSLSFIYLYNYSNCLIVYGVSLNQVMSAYKSSCFGTFESEENFKSMIPHWKNR